MFPVPTALEKLRNKEQQYEAAVKALHQATTYQDIVMWFRRVRKQYYQSAIAQKPKIDGVQPSAMEKCGMVDDSA